ncbi:MAG: arabinogalactan endo-1,4-beta-galactosidase [Anaerolineales bacterium]|nr:arabinogalactan endo-1,4-beta-galactosidase [Anaerolineales bacterium]
MRLKRLRLWIKLTAILLVLGIFIGCTPATTSEIEPKDTPTNLPDPTLESPIIAATPEPEPSPSTTAPSEIPSPTPKPITLINPGFENGETGGIPTGWNQAGSGKASYLEERGHSSDYRLTHQSSEAYQVETWQTVSGLENDWHTVRAWVRSSGGQNEVYIALRCGSDERRVHVPPTTPGYRWIQLVVSNQVMDGQCTIGLYSDGNPDTWASFDDIELVTGRSALSIFGADISSLKKSEDFGGVYRYADGMEGDALQILLDHGLNYARLRVFVDPYDSYHGTEEILEMAIRFKSLDIPLLVNLHYSDNWADPGKQYKPAAWEDYDFEQLKAALYDHTFDVCTSLVSQGTPPEMIQVGNEINAGMLWPDGDYNHMDNLAELLKEGYRAVKDCSPSTLVMLHIAEGGDNDMAQWWFGNMTRREVPFDVIGISYYPFWHGTLGQLQYNLNDITARYDKDVIVVETAYAFAEEEDDFLENIANSTMVIPGYPFTPEGQREMLRDIMAIVRAVPNGRGLGFFWWDATWTAVPGNGWDSTDPESGNAWENQALFDYEDRALPAMGEFSKP